MDKLIRMVVSIPIGIVFGGFLWALICSLTRICLAGGNVIYVWLALFFTMPVITFLLLSTFSRRPDREKEKQIGTPVKIAAFTIFLAVAVIAIYWVINTLSHFQG